MEFKKPGEKYLQKKKPQSTIKADALDPIDPKAKKPKKTKEPKAPKISSFKNPFKGKYRIPSFIALGVIAAAVVGCGVFFLICLLSSNEGQLKSDLERLGRDFYETYYYEQISKAYEGDKLENFLSKYDSAGIKVNLDNLNRYPTTTIDNKALIEGFINSKTDEPCDPTATKVSIYPEKPYGKSDYRLEISLSCGFDD